jgi:hypothetical protein
VKKLIPLFVLATCFISTVSCISKEMPVTETYYETEYRSETHSEIQDVVVSQNCGDDTIDPITVKAQWYASHLAIDNSNSLGGILGCNGIWYFGCEIPRHDTIHIKVTFYSRAGSPQSQENYAASAYDFGDSVQIAPPPEGKQTLVETPLPYQPAGDIYYTWTDLPGSHKLADWIDTFNTRLASAPNLGNWTSTTFSFDKGFTKLPDKLEFDADGVTNLAIIACGAPFDYPPVQMIQLTWCDNVTEKKAVAKEYQVPYQVEKQKTIMQTKQVPFWETVFH